MSCCRAACTLIFSLTLLTVAGCGARDAEPAADLDGYLGSYSLDLEASVTASLPVWKAKVAKGVDQEIADLVGRPPSKIKDMRDKQAKLVAQGESVVRKILERSTIELTLAKHRAFELKTRVPKLKEDGCSGLWTVEEGELFLVRDTVDGKALEEQSSLRLSIDGETLGLHWPGLAYVFVLAKN